MLKLLFFGVIIFSCLVLISLFIAGEKSEKKRRTKNQGRLIWKRNHGFVPETELALFVDPSLIIQLKKDGATETFLKLIDYEPAIKQNVNDIAKSTINLCNKGYEIDDVLSEILDDDSTSVEISSLATT